MTCKTREAALRGEREKPHLFLNTRDDRVFCMAFYHPNTIKLIEAFESRIDWSTWGASR